MSQSNTNIPVSSQEPEMMSASLNNPLDCSIISDTCGNSVVSEVSDNTENRKSSSQASKIARPTGLKLPTSGTSTSKIARLCNNATKPPVPLNPSSAPNYSSSLKTTYAKTYKYEVSIDRRTHTRDYKYVSGDRVSLKDIGIRHPVVHFNMNCKYYGSGTRSRGCEGLVFTPSSTEKVSDKWTRKRLTDVNETSENKVSCGEKWTAERKMSSGSMLSDSSRRSTPDELRKLRLSDASYSPDSFSDYWKSDDVDPDHPTDASIVLTENTDQFIIGDRVWVGGVKPGQIAYIGETQFAPGEWAGIVLDEPIGKNDGTVANIRYFQCEPKKGIFSRLTRLTKYPLVDGGAGEPAATRSSPAETKRSNGSLSGAVAKKSPLVSAPTSAIKSSISKPSSPDSGVLASPSLVVGDRVIIKSSQGSKAGILRYIGTTEFAPGEWCGVELDDPLGKNDGSVAGTRYFECQPKFGLFAPLHKVSRSPANKRLFQPCVVHHNRTSLRRQGSKESLVSISSAASTAASVRSTARKIGVKTPTPTATTTRKTLQETLKKKEQHIEQLLKERDLERAEVTRAANQADEAERQLACMKKEFEKYKKEVDAHVVELDAALCLMKTEKIQLISQLDDEKKKYEDLQFRFEEETIDKADIKSTVARYEEKLNLLQKTLSDERKRAENLESDSNKLFEAEEQMVIVKDELDSTKEELETHKRLRSTLEQKHISLEAHLTAARAEIESLKMENQSLKDTVSKDENTAKESLATAVQNLEEAKKDLERKDELLDQLSKQMESKNRDASEKEKELDAKYASLLQDLSEKHQAEMAKLRDDLNTTWQTKLKVLESQMEGKIEETKILEEKLEKSSLALSKNHVEKAAENARLQEAEAKLQKQVKEAVQELNEKAKLLAEEVARSESLKREAETLNSELEKTKTLLSTASESTDKRLEALNEVIDRQRKELDALKTEIEAKSNEFLSLKASEAQAAREHEEKLNEINVVMQQKDSELKKSKEESMKAKEDFDLKLKQMRDMNHTNEEALKSKIKQLEDIETEKKSELERTSRDLETLKNSLEARENELKAEQGNSRNLAEKFIALEENYRKVSEEKDRIELEAGDVSRKLQSTEDKLAQITSQKSKLEADISTFISSSNDSSVQVTKLNEDLRTKEKEMDALREEMSDKSRQFERLEQELRQRLEKQQENIASVNSERENEKRLHSEKLSNFREKLEASALAFKKAEHDWKEKVNAAAENAQLRINNLEEKIKNQEDESAEDRNRYEKHLKELLDVQKDLEKTVDQLKAERGDERNSLEKKIQELIAERTNLLQVAEKAKADSLATEKKVQEKSKKDAELHATEREKLENELKEIKETLSRTLDEFNKTKLDKSRLEEENSRLEKLRSQAEDMLNSTQGTNSEFKIRLSSIEGENEILKETMAQLREEKCALEKDATEKMMLVTELKMRVKSLEDSSAIGEAETEARVKNLQVKICNVEQLLEKTEAARAEEKSNSMERIRHLEGEIAKLKQDSSQLISMREKDVEKVNVVALQTRKQLDERNRECDEKAGKIEKLERNVQSVTEELNGERMRREDAENRCISFEKEILDWKEKFQNQEKLLQNSTDMVAKVTDISQKLAEADKREEELVKHSKSERERLVNLLETTKTLLNQQETQAKALAAELESLKSEKAEWQKKEKLLQDSEKACKVVKSEVSEEKSKNVLSEADFEKGQIDFLNSVIVDMQKKNDALKARIEILEMGYSPEDVEEFNLHNINARSVAPRLFCDICDRFDLHDTEDCPTQGGDDEMPPAKSSKSKAPPPERPYCDICEMFGHDTADCDDAETF